jgi:hypothetical protein
MDRAGRNPIHYAAASDEASEVASLLAGGESPDVQDKQGFAPLHLAAQQFAVATAQALLDAGATSTLRTCSVAPPCMSPYSTHTAAEISSSCCGHAELIRSTPTRAAKRPLVWRG